MAVNPVLACWVIDHPFFSAYHIEQKPGLLKGQVVRVAKRQVMVFFNADRLRKIVLVHGLERRWVMVVLCLKVFNIANKLPCRMNAPVPAPFGDGFCQGHLKYHQQYWQGDKVYWKLVALMVVVKQCFCRHASHG